MILKITNHCDMGCTHCLPNGEHMSEENFYLALEKIKDYNEFNSHFKKID